MLCKDNRLLSPTGYEDYDDEDEVEEGKTEFESCIPNISGICMNWE